MEGLCRIIVEAHAERLNVCNEHILFHFGEVEICQGMLDYPAEDRTTDFLVFQVILNQAIEHRKHILHAAFFIVVERSWLTFFINFYDAIEEQIDEVHTEDIRSSQEEFTSFLNEIL